MELDRFKLPKGAVIHYHGVPFRLEQDTEVAGRRENLAAATESGSLADKYVDRSLFERVFGKGFWG